MMMTEAMKQAVEKIVSMIDLGVNVTDAGPIARNILEEFYVAHSCDRLKELLNEDEETTEKFKELLAFGESQRKMLDDIEKGKVRL
jgi:uncharacterized protein YdaT